MRELTLNKVEIENCKKFIKEHSEECAEMRISPSGGVHYIFYSGGIGNVVMASCNFCKKERDITDYDSW